MTHNCNICAVYYMYQPKENTGMAAKGVVQMMKRIKNILKMTLITTLVLTTFSGAVAVQVPARDTTGQAGNSATTGIVTMTAATEIAAIMTKIGNATIRAKLRKTLTTPTRKPTGLWA